MSTPFLNGPQSDTIELIGANNADNSADSSNTVANEDGSVLERLEQIQEAVNKGSGTALAANTSLVDLLGTANATTTDSLHGKIGTDTEMADTSLYDMLGGPNATTTDSINGKIGTDTELADRSVYDILNGGGPAAAATAAAPANDVSLYGAVRHIVEDLIGQISNTGGTATVGGILGDFANSALVTRLNLLQGQTPATYVPGLGFRVTKAGAVDAASDDLFTVTGKVAITLWTGEVTNAIAAGSIDIDLRIKTTTEPLAAQTVIDGDAINTMYLVTGDVGETLNGGDTPTTNVAWTGGAGTKPIVIGQAGGSCTIEQVITGTGDAGDEITWTLFYMPLEASAAVAAAA